MFSSCCCFFPAIINQRISETIRKKEIKTNEVKGVIGSLYTRWGRSTCPTGSVYLFDGFVAGVYYDYPGGGVNYLCLPKDPIWADGNRTARFPGSIHGNEYQTSNSYANIWNHLSDHEAPCAVCQANGPTMMIPARKVCYDGWRLEYHGYLMTIYCSHEGSKEYLCVDAEATAAQGSSPRNENGALFYFVKPACGSLKCPPYDENKILVCVVCIRAQ
ncbi:hypothetical protein DPMN_024281 [Dreissena polymorpha]|uniref:Short-chain collagen C4 n=1 Tax=Dreissena polymorpha TaxID=45954 RepID=A0A9D4LP99_DREPO|nr:hypothetical protein DPMN_024281 [Dreissena polymorpha]